jgi:fumarate hydratase, class I
MEYKFEKLVQLGKDTADYVKISSDFVQEVQFEDQKILKIDRQALVLLAQTAFAEVSHKLRPAHQEQVAKILNDPEASDNDKYVALNMLENAVVAAEGELPFCQDTGTAAVVGKKGQNVFTGIDDEDALSEGIFNTYTQRNLRYSQIAPLTMMDEVNTKNNLPAQIDIYADQGQEYKFLFVAKGGGSANKSYFWPMTKSLLTEESLRKFMIEKVKSMGTAACPPYHFSIVIGGTSAEFNMKMVKLASAGYLDHLPTSGSEGGRVYRDLEWEAKVLEICEQSGIGAQFGGKYFAHDVRVIRAPRHAASCPVGMGLSCSADRNVKAKITKEGLFLERLENNPERLLPPKGSVSIDPPVAINLNRPMAQVLADLSSYPVKTRLSLTGTMIVARDIAHARLWEMVQNGEELPQYFKDHPVYYAGPAKTPKGMATGSFGPTTANRMDPYVNEFQKRGASMIMVAKGNRSQAVTDACKQYGGFYLGSIGGPAAILARDCIKKEELVDFEDLGMEAIRKIEVENFPAFILVDDKGNDFFAGLV